MPFLLYNKRIEYTEAIMTRTPAKDRREKMGEISKKILVHLQGAAGFIGALGIIMGALIGAGNWIVAEVNASTNARIDSLASELSESNLESQQAITRLELLTLMEYDPDNIVEIEKLAKKYFRELSGDAWMSGRYSRYAREHGLDTSFVTK